MRIQDEFTQNQSTNDKQLLKAEYGETQRNEFSDGGEMHLHRSNYNPDLNQTVKNATQETFAESASAGANASAASGGTAVSGSATASTIAAGSASAVVVASSVTITAISVVTGVSVAMHDYQCDVKALFVSSNQITYELTIEDLRQEDNGYDYDLETYEEEPCSIRVYNKYYDKTNKLSLGYNSDSFTNLSLGQTYNIVVTADSISGDKVLYEDVITTASVSRFLSFDIDPNYSYYDDALTVYLDYVDELDYLSDFYLSLTRTYEMEPINADGTSGEDYEDFEPESFTAVYALEKRIGSQDIHVGEQDMFIEPDVPYQYEFTYMKNNEKIVFDSGEMYFNTDYEGYSEVYGAYIMSEADFENMTFDVYLSFIDERDILSDFVLHLANPDFETIDIPLEETTDKQTISAEQYNVSFKLEYSAYLTYKLDDEEQTLDLDPVTFTNPNQPYSDFYGLIFDEKMDFDTGEFKVTLNYHDDLDYFDNFRIRFLNTELKFDETIELDKSTDEQLILGFEYGFDPEQEYTYIVYYTENGVEKSTDPMTFRFTDVYGRKSEFNEFVFNKIGNFLTNQFSVRLDYTDDFGYYSNFVLTFTRSTDNFVATIPLSTVTTDQTINGTDYDMMLRNKTYNYELSCLRQREQIVLDSGTATFTDNSGAVSQFNAFIFDGTANKLTNEITFRLDYVDDFGLYSDFVVTFQNSDVGGEAEIELENTTDEQAFPMTEYDLFFDTTYSYTLTCLYDGETQELATGTCTITDNSGAISEFTGATISSSANYVDRSFTITLNYQDDFDYFSDFTLTLRDTVTNQSTVKYLQKTTDPQTINVGEQQYNEDSGEYEYTIDILDHTVVYSLTYADNSVNMTITAVDNDQLPTFTNSLTTNFNGLVSDWKLVQNPSYPEMYYLPIKLDYIDEKRIYGSMEINMHIGSDYIGSIEYQNEVVPVKGDWINGNVSTELSLDDLTTNEIKFVVEGSLMSEKNHNQIEDEHVEFYQESHYLSVATEDKIYALHTDGTVYGTEGYFEVYFNGEGTSFANTQIIIETEGNTYTYDVTLSNTGDYINIMLDSPNESTIDYETFEEQFHKPVTIKFSYCTVTTTSSNTGPETEVFSDPIVIVCYTNFVFNISN